jgi:DNA-binding NarL/FixJ family response regulator
MMRVVIVEDEVLIAMALGAILGDRGHEVCAETHSAAAALDAIAAHRPDVLTCDVNLGQGGCGIDVAVQAYWRWGIRTIFISGNIDGALVRATRDIQPLGLIRKPLVMRRLLDAIDEAALQVGWMEPARVRA